MNALNRLRRLLPWVSALLLAAAIYDGYIFYSRWSQRRDSERMRMREEASQARKTVELLGGGGLGIVSFYASPETMRAGSHATLCYGVRGAKTVRIQPPVEEVWPALSHCLQVAPAADTEYRLIAEDSAGHSVSKSVVVKVVR